MGSVKDLIVIKEPGSNHTGEGIFIFSDRYSVFDWGEMPDHIPGKGESLCLITAYFFEIFEESGFKTHYSGLLDSAGNLYRLKDRPQSSNRMKVRLVRVLQPAFDGKNYDYSVFNQEEANYLIPLEVIYRFSLPAGSSVFKRLKEGSLSYRDLGLNSEPEPGTTLEKPFIDFSTKLEHYDRYLSREEALKISGLSDKKFEELISSAIKLAGIIKERYQSLGINNEDGKFEFAVDEKGELMLVDAAGTPDECRFSKDGVALSKELARIFYRATPWHREVEEARKKFGKNWREMVTTKPEPLNKEDLELLSGIYRSLANAITGKNIFTNAPDIDLLIKKIKERLNG